MCGIAGIHGHQNSAWIETMNASLVHRGPDGDGLYRDEATDLALAMRRLSIIDLAGGHQPMRSADGRFALVYNGEIYNAQELRVGLEAAGERFAELELSQTIYDLSITDSASAISPQGPPIPKRPVSTEQAIARLLEQRERYGFSYLQVYEGQMENFAPVVTRLAGK